MAEAILQAASEFLHHHLFEGQFQTPLWGED